MTREAVVVEAVRTAVGKRGGGLSTAANATLLELVGE
jgi:hypothetical protein